DSASSIRERPRPRIQRGARYDYLGPERRNRQTQETQNLPSFTRRVGSIPSSSLRSGDLRYGWQADEHRRRCAPKQLSVLSCEGGRHRQPVILTSQRSKLVHAGVVKLADAPDSKSGGVYPP